jgi:hypothetical protein
MQPLTRSRNKPVRQRRAMEEANPRLKELAGLANVALAQLER